jgi:hypothetical protein
MSDEMNLDNLPADAHAGLTHGNANRFEMSFKDDRLVLHLNGPLFPKQGGFECGGWSQSVDLTAHFEDIVRRVLQEKFPTV